MTSREIQFSLCRLANYLRERDGKGENDKKEKRDQEKIEKSYYEFQEAESQWKQYVDKEINRVEEFMVRKFDHVSLVQNKISKFYYEYERISKAIEEQGRNHELTNHQMIQKSIENCN